MAEKMTKQIIEKLKTFFKDHYLEFIVLGFCALTFVVSSPFSHFSDEFDKILGGKLILSGQLPYRDFFSHHMILQYYYSAVLYFVSNGNILLIRLFHNLIFFGWALLIYKLLRKGTNRNIALIFISTLSLTHLIWSTQQILTFSFVNYAIVTIVVLFFCQKQRLISLSWKHLGLFAAMQSVVVFTDLSYIFLVFGFYLFLNLSALVELRWKIRDLWRLFIIQAIPMTLVFFLVLISGIFNVFDDAVRFNTEYYSQFIVYPSGGIPAVFLHIIHNYFLNLSNNLQLIFSQNDFVPLLTFVITIIFIYFLIYRKRDLSLAALSVWSVIFSAPRMGEAFTFVDYSHRSGGYYNLVVVLGLLGCFYIFTNGSRKILDNIFIGAVALLLIIVNTTGVSMISLQIRDFISGDGIVVHNDPNLKANFLNSYLDGEDSFWSGPFDFETQVFSDIEQPTSYTFFIPWHEVCPECRSEFSMELDKYKPTVIFWDSSQEIWEIPTNRFDSTIRQYLSIHESMYEQIQFDDYPDLEIYITTAKHQSLCRSVDSYQQKYCNIKKDYNTNLNANEL